MCAGNDYSGNCHRPHQTRPFRFPSLCPQEEYEDASIVFSSHADTLQIAQCHIAGADERLFSQVCFYNTKYKHTSAVRSKIFVETHICKLLVLMILESRSVSPREGWVSSKNAGEEEGRGEGSCCCEH